ncbi:hypothetical protein BRN76_25165 [Xanthomonas oryzae pv. oryzae]|uniref:hypothetical protein n=1 Tax=Xanthomonas oryzae TaxID=347 RepID=UPI000DD8072D|nr:hypothetical protein [Xanthomonas oryzae]MDI9069056.1 hypothetical protein [Xanthomonas oryzae pv. oryzae]MDI9079480.1 hypothetical protein [Xanthomonas oryzae pv. oryzae]MDI9104089.1 hypothetical protein [Xanthomonas oryzae pv. oryzae]MDI9912818.1 hypothetical protein [Xanthomonas oryzae pv. oryzae]QDQ68812.1 hypothetical protein EBA19_25145 [Xanthomonas oryzae pv. oryzae]
MKIFIYIDSCAWNYILEHGIVLEEELPKQRYELRVTPEIDSELAAIPDRKSELKNSIQAMKERNSVSTTRSFGFGAPYVGFGQGSFQSPAEREWHQKYYLADPPLVRKGSGLPKGATDADLARRSSDAIILTAESAQTSGPLKSAANEGKLVIFLGSDFRPDDMRLGEYIEHRLRTRK